MIPFTIESAGFTSICYPKHGLNDSTLQNPVANPTIQTQIHCSWLMFAILIIPCYLSHTSSTIHFVPTTCATGFLFHDNYALRRARIETEPFRHGLLWH